MHLIWKRALGILALTLAAVALSPGTAAAAAPSVVAFSVPTGNLFSIAQAPDGAIWYVGEASTGTSSSTVWRLGEVGPDGPIKEIESADPDYGGLAVGAEGGVWLGSLTRFDPLTGFSQVSAPSIWSADSVTAARGGGVWFGIERIRRDMAIGNAIGRVTAQGQVSEYPLPRGEAGLSGIVETSDANVWFAESFGGAVGRLSPQGRITLYPLPGERRAEDVAADPRGGVLFTEGTAGIGRIDPAGHRTQLVRTFAERIAVTADGTAWFTPAYRRRGHLGRLGPDGAVSEIRLPNFASANDVVAGAEGDVWYTANYPGNCGIRCNENVEVPAVGVIGRITPAAVAEPTAGAATVRGGAVTVTMDCAGAAVGSCNGTFYLRRGGKAWGSANYALGAGAQQRLTISLPRGVDRTLASRGTLRTEAIAVESDGTRSKRQFVLQGHSS